MTRPRIVRAALADAGGEHDAVDPAHRGRQRTGLAGDPVDEIVERQCRTRLVAGEQVADVVADAGQALEAAIVVEEPLDLPGVEPLAWSR